MFIPTPCLPCQLACGWICTVKGWVVLESVFLAGICPLGSSRRRAWRVDNPSSSRQAYFAAAYVLREIIFPPLKSLFENIVIYQFLKGPLGTWIADVKVLFYGCMLYVAIGAAGLVGAILQIQILLWAYAAYLLVSLGLNAKKLWDVLQSILDVLDDLKKACGIVSAPFGGDCDKFFDELDYFMYGGAGFVFLCQSLTLICVLVLVRRNYKKTHSLLWTFYGHTCGGSRRSSSNDLEKAIPLGRRRRGATGATLLDEAPDEKAALREHVAALPRASFELARESPRKERRPRAGPTAQRTAFKSLGKARRTKGRRQREPTPVSDAGSSGSSSGVETDHAGTGTGTGTSELSDAAGRSVAVWGPSRRSGGRASHAGAGARGA